MVGPLKLPRVKITGHAHVDNNKERFDRLLFQLLSERDEASQGDSEAAVFAPLFKEIELLELEW